MGNFAYQNGGERKGERVIISRFAQSKYVNIIYFITIFSLLRNNASPAVSRIFIFEKMKDERMKRQDDNMGKNNLSWTKK